jgi:four helix bundle protein
MRQLSHEKLEVYQISVKFLAVAYRLIDSAPRGNGSVLDQLRRASQSIILNIAEGAGYPSTGKTKHHYAIARGSALECGAALDILKIIGIGDETLILEGKERLVSIVSMLSKMCRP